ncbi:MAG TPA: penicillin-binding protein 2 [Thermoleophilaceae bacterium]|nr:penicillin-binding protein 2 [Thermoleophilaceae bacterium]
MYLDNERRPTLTPQLAFRVAIVGGIALAAFAVIFFRLWYLQVLSGDKYVAEAQNNQLREVKVQAPRGEIVDREGRVLVRNRVGYAVKLTPDRLPEDEAERRRLYRRLAKLLRMRPRVVERRVEAQLEELPFSLATVKQDVRRETFMYIGERREDFPGVEIEPVFLREYPHREIGAHLFGHLGEASKEDLDDPQFEGVEMGDRIGKAGIEQEYDSILRGQNGATRVKVDALGNLKGRLETEETVQGRQLRLALDLDVQRTGQAALAGGTGLGAFAVMDIHNGEVLGLGSHPSFDPNLFAEVVREADYKALTAEDNGAPLTNRAVAGGYPTGSTFKLVTAVAALQSGLITPDTVLHDPGSLTVGNQIFRNAGDVAHGSLALRAALTVSSDVFFYQLGRDMDGRGDGNALQHWARRLGIGRPTGIDLPEEAPGFVPNRRWRDRNYRRFSRCVERRNPTPVEISLGECGWQDRPWSVGDNVNLSVGQGDLAANPLQMAVAYAAIGNGGRVLRPRLGQRIENSAGQAEQNVRAPTARRLKIPAEYRQAILDGLRGAANDPGGTSTAVFEGFPIEIAGKTGTAEKGLGRADQSWYVALAPWPDPKYAVAVTDEAGGFGADTAAPMVRLILAELFNVDEKQLVAGGGAPD